MIFFIYNSSFIIHHSFQLFLNLGGGEVFVVLLFVLLFFGSKNIPELARGLGRGIREFKDATNGIQKEIEDSSKAIQREVTANTHSIQREINSAAGIDINKKEPPLS